MKLVNHLDFGKLEARNMLIQPLASAPSSPVTGQAYFDTAVGFRIWDGTAFSNRATDSILHGGQTLAQVLARGAHTGTQLSTTISDLAATVQAYRLNQFNTPNADVTMGGFKLTNLAEPTVGTDAATMNFVQTQVSNAAAGIDAKASVRFATTANDTLSGLGARDGITPITGDRVLVKNQTGASGNGVYVAGSGAWVRATDADGVGEINPGAFWYVEEGTANGKTQWRVENTGTITLGSTPITINQFGGAAVAYTASLGVQLVTNDFRAQVVASGGLSVVAGGLQLDTTIAARKYSTTITGTSAAVVTHNLNTQDVIVSVRDSATNEVVLADVVANAVNTVTVTTAAGGAGAFRVTVIG